MVLVALMVAPFLVAFYWGLAEVNNFDFLRWATRMLCRVGIHRRWTPWFRSWLFRPRGQWVHEVRRCRFCDRRDDRWRRDPTIGAVR